MNVLTQAVLHDMHPSLSTDSDEAFVPPIVTGFGQAIPHLITANNLVPHCDGTAPHGYRDARRMYGIGQQLPSDDIQGSRSYTPPETRRSVIGVDKAQQPQGLDCRGQEGEIT